jgi:hypothetical protein
VVDEPHVKEGKRYRKGEGEIDRVAGGSRARSDGSALGSPYVARGSAMRRNYSRPRHNKAGFAAFEVGAGSIRAAPARRPRAVSRFG